MSIDKYIDDKYVEAAIAKLPRPAPNVDYLIDASELLQVNDAKRSSDGFKNPVGGAVEEIGGYLTTITNMAEARFPKFSSKDPLDENMNWGSDYNENSLVSYAIMGELAKNTKTLADAGSFMNGSTSRMFTETYPFSEKMGINDGVQSLMKKVNPPSIEAIKMGVPQVSTLIGMNTTQQALEASMGEGQVNPCAPITETIGSIINTVQTVSGELVSKAVEAIEGLGSFVFENYTTLVNHIKESLGDLIQPTKEMIAEYMDKAKDFFDRLGTSGEMGAVKRMITGVTEALSVAIEKTQDIVGSIVSGLNNAATMVINQASISIASMLSSLVNNNPCVQGMLMGENSVLSDDMATLVRSRIPPHADLT